jgi:hypothetical protein
MAGYGVIGRDRERDRVLRDALSTRTGDIQRKFDADEWAVLGAAGWPLGVVGTLKAAAKKRKAT